jgi:hypothetical protein
MAEEPTEPNHVLFRVAWFGVEDVPITFVNQMIGQIDDKREIIISLGQATPPVLLDAALASRRSRVGRGARLRDRVRGARPALD